MMSTVYDEPQVVALPAGITQEMVDGGVRALREAGFYADFGDSDHSAVIAIFLAMGKVKEEASK